MLMSSLNTLRNGGHALPQWEFQMLIGFEREEVRALLDMLAGLQTT